MEFKKIWDFLEDEYNRRKDEYGNEKCSEYFKVDIFLDISNKYKFVEARILNKPDAENKWNPILDNNVYELKTESDDIYYIANVCLTEEEIEWWFSKMKINKNICDIWEKPILAFSTIIFREEMKKYFTKSYKMNIS